MSYRMGPHSTADDPNKYRKNEVTEGSEKDPVTVSQRILKEMNILDDDKIREINDEVDDFTSKLINKYEKEAKPDKSTILDNLYEEEPWYISEERGDLQ